MVAVLVVAIVRKATRFLERSSAIWDDVIWSTEIRNYWYQKKLETSIIVSIMPVDDIAPSGARPSVGRGDLVQVTYTLDRHSNVRFAVLVRVIVGKVVAPLLLMLWLTLHLQVIISKCIEFVRLLASWLPFGSIKITMSSQIARFVGPTWGPPGSWRPQVGPTLSPWIL